MFSAQPFIFIIVATVGFVYLCFQKKKFQSAPTLSFAFVQLIQEFNNLSPLAGIAPIT